MSFVIGLTGGIGSGKSTVTDYFAKLGVPIIDADLIAREIVSKQQPLLNQIVAKFGATVLHENGELDRSALRAIIFNDPAHRRWLESLLHPEIDKVIKHRIQLCEAPYCIVSIPLLAENYDRYKVLLNHILVIDLPLEQQLARALARDQHDPLIMEQIIAMQASREHRLQIADTVLPNEGNLQELANGVKELHAYFLELANA